MSEAGIYRKNPKMDNQPASAMCVATTCSDCFAGSLATSMQCNSEDRFFDVHTRTVEDELEMKLPPGYDANPPRGGS
jgi:hypothetical protein